MSLFYILVRVSLTLVYNFLNWRANTYEHKYKKRAEEFNGLKIVSPSLNDLSNCIAITQRAKVAQKVSDTEGWWKFYEGWAESFGSKRDGLKEYKGKWVPYILGHLDVLGMLVGIEQLTGLTLAELVSLLNDAYVWYTTYISQGTYGGTLAVATAVVSILTGGGSSVYVYRKLHKKADDKVA
jgi:hypothetical protein